jgi:short-subunit dehydrogenase
MKKEFKDKTFIITGASKGLGEVIAKEFSKYGMNLILFARDKKELERVKKECSNKSNIDIYSFDLLDTQSIEENVKKVQSKFKSIDVIIHVAGGGYGFREPLLSYEKFLTLMNLNLFSIVQINNLIIPNMIKNQMGNIVHIGSIAALECVASVGYNTSKASLNAYVRSLGNEFAKDNLIISGINPGGFEAPNNAMERLKINNLEAYNEFIEKKLPRKRMGQAKELVDIIKLLSSRKAGMFCGSMITVDAGEGKTYERI